MKTYILSFLVILLSSLPVLAQSQQAHSHDHHLETLVTEYLEVKDALTKDNFEDASAHISAFAKEVKENSEMNHHTEHAEMHARHHQNMLTAVNSAVSSEDIADLRSSFADITGELLKALKNQGYDHQKLFVQFCPMAEEGDGAKWISNNEKPGNPYLGEKMSSCRSTVDALN